MFSTARQAEPLLHPPAQEQSTRHQLRDSTLRYEVWSQFHNLLPVLAELYPPKPPPHPDSTAEGLSPRALRRRPQAPLGSAGVSGSPPDSAKDTGPGAAGSPPPSPPGRPRAPPALPSSALAHLQVCCCGTDKRHCCGTDTPGLAVAPGSLPACCCPIVPQRACKEPISK